MTKADLKFLGISEERVEKHFAIVAKAEKTKGYVEINGNTMSCGKSEKPFVRVAKSGGKYIVIELLNNDDMRLDEIDLTMYRRLYMIGQTKRYDDKYYFFLH